jgi:uncharacterized protein YqeY
MLKARIDQDLKAALLAGDKVLATTLRSIKSAILYAEVAQGARGDGLSDEEIIALLTKQAKKRQESADLYKRGGNDEKAEAELAEKRVIEGYLPKQLTDDELIALINTVIKELGVSGTPAMGQVIGVVKQKAAGQADGARIAQLVKQKLEG